MQVEVFSDVACPWCYIGKRHLEQALADFPHDVTVTYRSFQLDPTTPTEATGTLTERLAAKYGVSEAEARAMNERVAAVAATAGITFDMDAAHPANTFDAHRLLYLAAAHHVQAAAKERLMAAYFSRGEHIGDRETLVAIAAEIGLDADEARAVLDSGSYADEVRADLALARTFGISSVPFFVIDRHYGISGAQPAATLRAGLEQAWLDAHPLTMVGEPGDTEADDSADSAVIDDAAGCADGVCRV